jgi:hypothetical protein
MVFIYNNGRELTGIEQKLQQSENGDTCVQSPYPNKFKRCNDLQLITRLSQTCSELVPILGTAWKFVASQMLHK